MDLQATRVRCAHPVGARAIQEFHDESGWKTGWQVEQCYDCGAIWVAPKKPDPREVPPPDMVVCWCEEFPYAHTLTDHFKLLPESTE